MRTSAHVCTSALSTMCFLVIVASTSVAVSTQPDDKAQIDETLAIRLSGIENGRRGLSQMAPTLNKSASSFKCPTGRNFKSDQQGNGMVQAPSDKATV